MMMMDNDEIQEVMGQAFGDMDGVDDDDLEDELAALGTSLGCGRAGGWLVG